MTPVIRVNQISDYVDQEVTVKGWVYNRTDKGKLVFLLVRDGYGFIQCVAFKNDLSSDAFDQISHLLQETSVLVTGQVRADPRAPGVPGGYEIGIRNLEVVQTET